MRYLSKIEDFFSGKLEGEELERFKNDLETDFALKNEFETYERAINFILSQEKIFDKRVKELQDFEPDLNIIEDIDKYGSGDKFHGAEHNILYSLKKESTRAVLKRNAKKRLVWFSVAAGVLMILGITGLLLFDQAAPDNDELYSQYFTPYQHTYTTRSVPNLHNKDLAEGIFYYNHKDYNLALQKLKMVPDSLDMNCELPLIRAVCCMENNNFIEALHILQGIDKDDLVYYSSLWYRGLCYIKLNEKDKALAIFKEVYHFEPFYKKETKSILKYLK